MAEMAAIFAGGKAAGIYPTDTADQVAFKSRHSAATIMVLEDKKKLDKCLAALDRCTKMKAIVCWGFEPEEKEVKRADGSSVQVLSWAELLKAGSEVPEETLQAALDAQKPGDVCALIYTSGTTGDPKAVMITHDNLVFESSTVLALLPQMGSDPRAGERILSYLPLSHVAGMMVDVICPIFLTARRASWSETYFARPYDLKAGTVGDRLRCVKPTMFLGVPRVWEKIAEKMKAIGAKTTGLKKSIATWAKEKGLQHARNCQIGGTGEVPTGYGTASSLVLNKVKVALGLEECKFGFTGAAPIQKQTLEYFGALGIQINEVYGMSECCGATTWSTDSAHLWGSCGWAMPGTEVKVYRVDPDDINKKVECPRAADIFNSGEAEQGELCFRGRNVMLGYLANPDLGEEHVELIRKKTAGAIDADGWLHSGDKACMGENGMVKITGRYKELIIGAGGENIAPVPIENSIKKLCPAISNCLMIGDKRKFNIALISLKAEGATGDLPGGNDLAGAAKTAVKGVTTITGAMQSKAFQDMVTQAIVKTNKGVPNNASKIQRWTMLPCDFSVQLNDLTPTLKIKRSVIEKKHAPMIEKVYSASREHTYVQYEEDLMAALPQLIAAAEEQKED